MHVFSTPHYSLKAMFSEKSLRARKMRGTHISRTQELLGEGNAGEETLSAKVQLAVQLAVKPL